MFHTKRRELKLSKVDGIPEFNTLGLSVYQAHFLSKKGTKVVMTGCDPSPTLAKEKALSEALERFVCEDLGASSNGFAAHPDESEAKQRAILEIIERDALMCSWFTGGHLKSVEKTPQTEQIEKLLDKHGYQMRLIQIPHEARNVIVIAGVAFTENLNLPAFFIGMAAGLNAKATVDKAATEVLLQVSSRITLLRLGNSLDSFMPSFAMKTAGYYYDHKNKLDWQEWLNGEALPPLNPPQTQKSFDELNISSHKLLEPREDLLNRYVFQAKSPDLQTFLIGEEWHFNQRRISAYEVQFGTPILGRAQRRRKLTTHPLA